MQIICKILVLVRPDVILRQIGEDTDIEQNSCRTIQHKRLGGHLHHDRLHAVIRHFAQRFLQRKRLRRRIVRRPVYLMPGGLDGADQSDIHSGPFQNGAHQVCGCGLSLRAGNADHLQLFSRMPVKGCRHQCHSAPRRLHTNQHQIICGRPIRRPYRINLMLNKDGRGSGGRHLRNIAVPVRLCSANGKKQDSPASMSGIVRDIQNLLPQKALSLLRILRKRTSARIIKLILQFLYQFLQLHW